MILLEEVSLGSRFCGFKSPSWAQRCSLLNVFIWRCEFSATSLASCLPACCHVPHLDENGINLWNWKLAPTECFLRVGVVRVSIHSNGTLTKTPTMNSFGWIFHFGSRDETVTTTNSQSSEYFFCLYVPFFPVPEEQDENECWGQETYWFRLPLLVHSHVGHWRLEVPTE